MANTPKSVLLNSADVKTVAFIRKQYKPFYGPTTFTFIVRMALKALEEKLRAE